MTTLKNVAEEAQTSITTVSLVLNNKADQRGISLDTQARVRRAAKHLSYRRNPHARALRTGYSNVIGVIGIDLDSPIPHAKTYAAAEILHNLGFSVVTYDFAWQQQGAAGLAEFVDGLGVAGLLLAAYTPEILEPLQYCKEHGVALVAMDDWRIPDITAVTVDRVEGSYQAFEHLIGLGHKHIAFTASSTPQSPLIQARVEGYCKAHDAHKLPIDKSLFMGLPDAENFEQGYYMTESILQHPLKPTAVFCTNDEVALGVMRGLYEHDVRFPDKMSIIGFNDSLDAAKSVIPLTTVHQPIAEVVAAAVDTLKQMIENPSEPRTPYTTVIPATLVVRKSTAKAPQ